MVKVKMNLALNLLALALLAWAHPGHCVVNKGASNSAKLEKSDKDTKVEDRISNSYGPPALSNEYGAPFNRPAPVYGPPELTGDLRPTQIYPPPPPELPPPIKQSYGPPVGQLSFPWNKFVLGLNSKPHFNGPPKPQYGPPHLVASFRPQKGQFRPPFPSSHGPPIPLSVETYGPPPAHKQPVAFHGPPQKDYGPPQKDYGPPQKDYGPPQKDYGPPQSPPVLQQQYGPPSSDLYGPPPAGPPPGVPAPPTPPDIKYDGWQPIAGLVSGGHEVSRENAHSGSTVQAHVPSDSYGVPIHNAEAQNLKMSVHQSSVSPDSNGLPPPQLPEYEPLHNEAGPIKSDGRQLEQHHHQQGSLNVEPLSIVKTVGFELLPNPDALSGDLQSLSHSEASSSSSSSSSEGHGNLGFDSGALLTTQALPSGSYGAPFRPEVSSVDLSLQKLPPPSPSYGPPPFPGGAGAHLSFHHGHRGSSSFHKHHQHRHHAPPPRFGPILSPHGSLVPPRNREPIKFRDTVPPLGLLTKWNKYLPPVGDGDLLKPHKTYGPPSSQNLNQHLPSFNAPLNFHDSSSSSLTSSTFASGFSTFGKSNSLDTVMAAPNAQYGTPLTFTSFNTPAPAPVLTYGAPNFGPSSSLVSTATGFGGSLYDGSTNSLESTYGTPLLGSGPLLTQGSSSFHQNCPNGGYSFQDTSSSSHFALANQQNLLLNVPTLTSLYLTPAVNELQLQNQEQPKGDLKDSYGNSVGVTFQDNDQAGATLVGNDIEASSGSTSTFVSQNELPTAEALTGQPLGEGKSYGSNDVDASQFLKSHEGSEALALAQGLTAQGADGFQIQGSKGTYMLQIQPADGGFGTENSDGSIRHDQVLSNGLLQDILAAIEQPENGRIEIQGSPLRQPLEGYPDLSHAGSSVIPSGQFVVSQSELDKSDVDQQSGTGERGNSVAEMDQDRVVILFDKQESGKETRSVSKNEGQAETVNMKDEASKKSSQEES